MEELRVHDVPCSLYIAAHKRAFSSRGSILALYTRFNDSVKQLVDEWWPRIEDSRFAKPRRHPALSSQSTPRP
jgi:hypothetical protein